MAVAECDEALWLRIGRGCGAVVGVAEAVEAEAVEDGWSEKGALTLKTVQRT